MTNATSAPRTMRLERRGILLGISILTDEGWLVFNTPAEGFGNRTPEEWVIARAREHAESQKPSRVPAETQNVPEKRRARQKGSRKPSRRIGRRCGTVMEPSGPVGSSDQDREEVGGAKRDRTADLLNAIQALSQLSYSPIRNDAAWGRHRVYTNDPP